MRLVELARWSVNVSCHAQAQWLGSCPFARAVWRHGRQGSPSEALDADLTAVAQQLQEMDLVRQKIYQLEQAQMAMKTKCVDISPDNGVR